MTRIACCVPSWRQIRIHLATNTREIAMKTSFPRLHAAVSVFIAVSASIVHAATVDIIATDLANPRGIAIGPAGRILVAEAGAGGVTVSMTGHVTEVFHGQVRRLVTLPSIDARPLLPPGERRRASTGPARTEKPVEFRY